MSPRVTGVFSLAKGRCVTYLRTVATTQTLGRRTVARAQRQTEICQVKSERRGGAKGEMDLMLMRVFCDKNSPGS